MFADNMLVAPGCNWRGFKDADLTSAPDCTIQGWILGMRYTFDETLFKGCDRSANKALNPTAAPPKS